MNEKDILKGSQKYNINSPVKLSVDHALCKSVGVCVQKEPSLFRFEAGSKKSVPIIQYCPSALVPRLRKIAELCPEGAIRLEPESIDT
jgi:ferredoxin